MRAGNNGGGGREGETLKRSGAVGQGGERIHEFAGPAILGEELCDLASWNWRGCEGLDNLPVEAVHHAFEMVVGSRKGAEVGPEIGWPRIIVLDE